MNNIKKVLLIHPEGNVYNNPTLKCLVQSLLSCGVEITVRYSRYQLVSQSQLKFPFNQIKGIKDIGYGYLITKIKNLVFFHLSSFRLAWLTVWLENQFIYETYDLAIGVDRQGLIEAGCLHRITNTPFVFFSFEILFESETSTSFKSLERRFARYVSFWFVQDKQRASYLQYENHLNPETCRLIPLASTGTGNLSTNRLRDQLGIEKDNYVAIFIGNVSSWSMAAEIVAESIYWPDNWSLIVHDRYGKTNTKLEKLGVNLSSIPTDKVYLSNQSKLKVDDMGEVLSGISVGLAFYKPLYNTISRYPSSCKNIEYLGLASGKISTFLRYGIPIITNEIGLYADLAKEHGFGLVCQNPSHINELLPICLDPILSSNAISFYKTFLDFSNYENLLWKSLTSAVSQSYSGFHNYAGH